MLHPFLFIQVVMTIHPRRAKVALCSLLTFVTIIVGNTSSYGYVAEKQPGSIKPQLHDPHAVVQLYIKAVARGELVVFERVLTRSLIVPISVEYVYELDKAVPRIKVYSKLKQPMPVPGQPDCELRAVSAILDASGHILETEAHIWSD
jgi:hypothetical protein